MGVCALCGHHVHGIKFTLHACAGYGVVLSTVVLPEGCTAGEHRAAVAAALTDGSM
jgi:hypothetical protein